MSASLPAMAAAPAVSVPEDPADPLAALLARIRACRVCVEQPRRAPLPHEPRPVLRVGSGTGGGARILLASQAPGTKVHLSGLPFTDASGDRLRAWLGVDAPTFYDATRIAIAPMGFCFPGQDAKGGDLPPRPECAATWHDQLFAALPAFDLVLVIGAAAQNYHLRRLGLERFLRLNLTERMLRWREIFDARQGPRLLPLPHPSWRNTGWLKRHPWFESELLPVLRAEVAAALR
ncbi:uracil-DNA glycosylase family protein [Ancylobacter sp. 6x-1]|uniref:Uracil-DNA glycosylase family protein n=1 Tax=Ancylobacter crimeensis TaxID=2579147 RepID=A0ABT0D8A0_9HYPH|nr:uracil-DNA glycosylase family protein [Ancylobacter crimeensis]MCK0196186.1 uracil-DNA glycosylase family protein [Ancylobacter crimeensis]